MNTTNLQWKNILGFSLEQVKVKCKVFFFPHCGNHIPRRQVHVYKITRIRLYPVIRRKPHVHIWMCAPAFFLPVYLSVFCRLHARWGVWTHDPEIESRMLYRLNQPGNPHLILIDICYKLIFSFNSCILECMYLWLVYQWIWLSLIKTSCHYNC